MAAIAAAADVSRQAVYLHFSDRSELLLATVAHVDRSYPLEEMVQDVWDQPNARAALERYVELVADSSPHIIDVARTIDAARLTDPDLEAAWADRMAGRRAACARLIQWLDDDGELASDWQVGDATDYLWVQGSLRVWDDLCNRRGWPRAQYVTTMQRTLRAALLTD